MDNINHMNLSTKLIDGLKTQSSDNKKPKMRGNPTMKILIKHFDTQAEKLKAKKIKELQEFNYKNVVIPQSMIKKIKIEHKKTMLKLLKRDQARKLESIKRDIENSKKELIAFKWLINHGIDFDNCIYYNHTNKFSFGWRKPLTETEQETLHKNMNGFPYSWEIQKKEVSK